MESKLNIVCLESEALTELIDTVVDRLLEKYSIEHKRWILGEEVMTMLGIKSTTTLAKLRNEGLIRFSQPTKKVIVYDKDSIDSYLEKSVKDTFT